MSNTTDLWLIAIKALLLSAAAAADAPPDPPPKNEVLEAVYFPFLEEGRFGLIDRSGTVVAAARYEAIDACMADSTTAGWFPGATGELFQKVMALRACYPVRQPLIRMRLGSQWGYLSGAGEEAIPAIYQAAGRFSSGLARVRRNEKWGYLDLTGRLVIEASHGAASDFFGQIAAVEDLGRWRLIDRQGAPIGDIRFDVSPAFQMPAGHERELIPVNIGGKWGYVTALGELAIQPRFDEALAFREGLANVRVNKHFGFIDRSGRLVVEPKFVVAGPFSEGRALAAVRQNKYGYIDRTGAWVVRPAYEYGFRFSDGLARVNTGKGWVCIDVSGKVVIGPPLNCGGVEDGVVLISERGRSGYADPDGKVLIEPRFDQIKGFSEGLAAVAVGKKWGYVDTNGRMVIAPAFDDAHGFRDGLALVERGDELAYIDRDGEIVYAMRVPGYGASIKRL